MLCYILFHRYVRHVASPPGNPRVAPLFQEGKEKTSSSRALQYLQEIIVPIPRFIFHVCVCVCVQKERARRKYNQNAVTFQFFK